MRLQLILISFCILVCAPAIHPSIPHSPAASDSTLTMMMNLFDQDEQVKKTAYRYFEEQGTLGMAPALLDMLYFRKDAPRAWHNAMESMTGKRYGNHWPNWMEWLGKQEFEPDANYRQFKAILFQSLDPYFRRFLNPARPSTIRWDEIVWGGVKKDGIPDLRKPPLLAGNSVVYLNDKNPVFGIVINGEARAYPLRILEWHELANDTLGGQPFSLVYCTLCGAGVAYNTKTDSSNYTFGTSGLLYRSNKLMYDRQTNSLWSSLDGKPVIGPLVGKGIELEPLPLVHTTWGKWKKKHPNSTVLDVETGHNRKYDRNKHYQLYHNSHRTMFPVAWRDNRLIAKDRVFGLRINKLSRAYPIHRIKGRDVLQDAIGELEIVLLIDGGSETVRAYEAGEFNFNVGGSDDILRDQQSHQWRVEEHQLSNLQTGETLSRLPGHLAYWFGWYAFFPETTVWEKGKS